MGKVLLLCAWSGLVQANVTRGVSQAVSPASLRLLEAAYVGSVRNVRLALQQGADIHARFTYDWKRDTDYRGILRFEYGKSAIVLAAQQEHPEVVSALLENEASVDDGGAYNVLQSGITKNNVEIVRLALTHGADPNGIGMPPDPALTRVAWQGVYAAGKRNEAELWSRQVEMMRLLTEHGADVNLGGLGERTALKVSAYGGFVAGIEFLIANDADVNILMPLREAAENAAGLTAIRMIINAGAEVNAANEAGDTALHAAAGHKEGLPRTVQLLLDKGADGNIKNNAGMTPLDIARQRLQRWKDIAGDGFMAAFYNDTSGRIERCRETVKILEEWVAQHGGDK